MFIKMIASSFRKTFFIALLLSLVFTGFSQGFLNTKGTEIINEKGENILLRGIGLGGWMLQEGYMLKIYRDGQQNKIRSRMETLIGKEKTAAFYDAWLANHTQKADIDSMKAWGFNSVRLPMHYNLYTLPVEEEPVKGENTWLEKGFRLTDSLLSWCKANQMYLILDMHAAPGGQGNDMNISDGNKEKPFLWESEANKAKLIALWKEIARRYAAEPWIGAYDIINEPNWGFENPEKDPNGLKEKGNVPLRKLMVDITNAIREVDQKHIIIIEGNGWGNNYNGIFPPWDKNMVLSYHKYWNNNTPASIKHILEAREKYQVPVWLGETGENSNVWFAEAIHLLESHNIGWAWWPLKKIGSNNPLEIRSNPEYDQLVAYWNGNGERPSAASAQKGLMQLAENLRIENNRIHYDVVDAMIRQPFSHETKPFAQHTIAHGAEIAAVEYDLGRNGAAYWDSDTADYHIDDEKARGGNRGRAFRNDGVDIEEGKSGKYITHTEKGEWLQFTANVKEEGNYTVKLRISAPENGGKASIIIGKRKKSSVVHIPATNGPENWQMVEIDHVFLEKGKQGIRFFVEEGGFHLHSLQFILNGKAEIPL